MKKENKKYSFVFLGLLTYLGFWFDNLLPKVLFLVNKKTYGEYDFFESSIYFIVICAIWGIWAYLMFLLAKNEFKFNICEFKDKPTKNKLIMALLLLLLITIVMAIFCNFQLKPIAELNKKMQIYNTLGIITFILQYIYYVFETALIILTIAFGQKAGEQIFSNKKIPWGGLFLGITWGLMHTVSKNLSVGIFLAITSVLYGVAYLLLKKNIKYAYPIIFLMFVL